MTAPTKIQVYTALVTLAEASGMLQAIAEDNERKGLDVAEYIRRMMEDLDGAREILRLAVGAP